MLGPLVCTVWSHACAGPEAAAIQTASVCLGEVPSEPDLDSLLGNESFCQWSSSPSPQVHAVSGSLSGVPGLTPGPLSRQLSFLNTWAWTLVLGS